MTTKAVRLSVVSAALMAVGVAQASWQLALHYTMQPQHAHILTCSERTLADAAAPDLPASERPVVEATVEYQSKGAPRIAALVDDRPPGFQCAAAQVQVFISPLSPAKARFTHDINNLIGRMVWGALVFFAGLLVHTYAKHISITGGARRND